MDTDVDTKAKLKKLKKNFNALQETAIRLAEELKRAKKKARRLTKEKRFLLDKLLAFESRSLGIQPAPSDSDSEHANGGASAADSTDGSFAHRQKRLKTDDTASLKALNHYPSSQPANSSYSLAHPTPNGAAFPAPAAAASASVAVAAAPPPGTKLPRTAPQLSLLQPQATTRRGGVGSQPVALTKVNGAAAPAAAPDIATAAGVPGSTLATAAAGLQGNGASVSGTNGEGHTANPGGHPTPSPSGNHNPAPSPGLNPHPSPDSGSILGAAGAAPMQDKRDRKNYRYQATLDWSHYPPLSSSGTVEVTELRQSVPSVMHDILQRLQVQELKHRNVDILKLIRHKHVKKVRDTDKKEPRFILYDHDNEAYTIKADRKDHLRAFHEGPGGGILHSLALCPFLVTIDMLDCTQGAGPNASWELCERITGPGSPTSQDMACACGGGRKPLSVPLTLPLRTGSLPASSPAAVPPPASEGSRSDQSNASPSLTPSPSPVAAAARSGSAATQGTFAPGLGRTALDLRSSDHAGNSTRPAPLGGGELDDSKRPTILSGPSALSSVTGATALDPHAGVAREHGTDAHARPPLVLREQGREPQPLLHSLLSLQQPRSEYLARQRQGGSASSGAVTVELENSDDSSPSSGSSSSSSSD